MISNTSMCIHRVLEGVIQEFVLTEASRPAVDTLFNSVEQLMAEAYERNDMSIIAGRFLLDSSIGILPLNYAFARARMMAKKFPSHPQSRTALLFPRSPLVRTIDFSLRTLVSVRFFSIDERETALMWLRAGVAAKH